MLHSFGVPFTRTTRHENENNMNNKKIWKTLLYIFVKFLVITTQCSSYMPQITITWNLQVYEVSHISKWDTKIYWYPNKNNHPYILFRQLIFSN